MSPGLRSFKNFTRHRGWNLQEGDRVTFSVADSCGLCPECTLHKPMAQPTETWIKTSKVLITCETGAKKPQRLREFEQKTNHDNLCLPLIFSTHIKKSSALDTEKNHKKSLPKASSMRKPHHGFRQKPPKRLPQKCVSLMKCAFCIFWVAKIGEDFQPF